ncbi:hypothetical protein BDZ97DRAFT_259630 [Flammula alnicola]|nr:hypothetical protein BDZ97DRAFT_259630 [Flammula alnicola]
MAWPNLSVFDLIQSTSNLYSSYVTNTPERDFVERLPANIVREIFVLALFFGSEVKGNVSNTPILSDYCKTTPFPFSQVNHRWRVAVQNMKFLWRQVIVHQPNDALIYRTEAWMRYVNDGELLVTLRQSNEPTDPEHEATAKILDLFASRVQTCTNAKFYFRGKIPETFLGYLQSLQRQDALALIGLP